MMIQNHEEKIWLPLELVIELKVRDSQHNSFVGIKFSQSAEATTVYPKKYAHGFVVLCFVVVM